MIVLKHRFVLLKTSIIEVECPCTHCNGFKKIEAKKGTILTLTPDKKYVDGLGWYVLIDVNQEFQVYINIHDFEHYYFQQLFCSFIDFDLKYNYLEYKINQALDKRDEEAFHLFSSELSDLKMMHDTIRKSMGIHNEI